MENLTEKVNDKPVLDVNQSALRCPSREYVLSNPDVIAALYESAYKLGPLTRVPNARVTFGNMNE